MAGKVCRGAASGAVHRNLTVSANLFVDNRPRRRLLMLAAMLCLAVMAAAVPEADAGRGSVYALCYAGTRLVLLGLWWPTTTADHAWTLRAGFVGVLGFVLLAALWWSYFDFGAASAELMFAAAQDREAYLLARDVGGFLHFFVTAAVLGMAGGLATAVEEADHAHLPSGAVWALAGGLALYHAAHACIALRYKRPPSSVAVWAVPGIGIPLLVVLGSGHLAPWVVVLLLAAEAIVHLLYARKMLRRRVAAAAAPTP
ncbi:MULTISPECIES: low temperature requirement protein A [unclassified Streptomyces]|uniref:low temperature requirement protein A n=1 Tax=unclassified Streptomyces TaxID=2593676 RepID=UPI001BE58FFB|nr:MULTISPECIES: low temperature requirement protein A [unclassified Streptomyces]MBT2406173.1 low temperature requirement protein A [Streptomyces sp. ISL-21]MBT2609231.1 low temperature requirement protein A [Streptomyces sp. ISL-87]